MPFSLNTSHRKMMVGGALLVVIASILFGALTSRRIHADNPYDVLVELEKMANRTPAGGEITTNDVDAILAFDTAGIRKAMDKFLKVRGRTYEAETNCYLIGMAVNRRVFVVPLEAPQDDLEFSFGVIFDGVGGGSRSNPWRKGALGQEILNFNFAMTLRPDVLGEFDHFSRKYARRFT